LLVYFDHLVVTFEFCVLLYDIWMFKDIMWPKLLNELNSLLKESHNNHIWTKPLLCFLKNKTSFTN
jgi:hypothetical protein